MGKFVPVLGTMRSGTSLVSNILNTLGVCMGIKWLTDDPEWCEDGFWCDEEFHEIHQHLLGMKVNDYHVNQSIPHPEHLPKLERLIDKRERKYDLWGCKSHLMPLIWPYYKLYCKHDIYMICTERPLVDSIASLAARAEISDEEARKILDPMFEAVNLAYWQHTGPKLKISFLDLLEKPKDQVQLIADFIQVPATQKAIDKIKPHLCRFCQDKEDKK